MISRNISLLHAIPQMPINLDPNRLDQRIDIEKQREESSKLENFTSNRKFEMTRKRSATNISNDVHSA